MPSPHVARIAPLLAVVGLCALPSQAAKVPVSEYTLQTVPYDIRIRDFQFPSGLRIVFQEDHTRPVVSVNSVFDVGSAEDPVGMDGLAHLVEHLNFRAVHGDLPKVMDFVKQLGGNFNATTATDRTNYLTIAPKDALVPLLRLESLRMTNIVQGVTEEVMNVEREVVRNELRGNREQGPGDIWAYLMEQLYPDGHHDHRTTIGSHETINAITLPAIQKWTQQYYRPENATILVVGDFDPDQISTYIGEAFRVEQLADPANPTAPITLVERPPRIHGPSEDPPPPVTQEIRTYKGLVDKKNVLLGWSLPGAYRGEDAQWALTVGMMNIAIGKYLFPSWDYENESIESFGCFYNPGKVSSQAMCYVEIADDEKPERIVRKALDGLYELWNTDNRYQMQRGQIVAGSIDMDAIFKLSKLQWMASLLEQVEDVSDVFGRGAVVSEWMHYTGNPLYYSSQFEELSRVDISKAADMAYKYLNRDRYTAVVIEPFSDEEKAKAERKGLEGTYDGVTMADQGAKIFRKGELTDAVIQKAAVPPPFEKKRAFTLENGLRVVIVPFGYAPVTRVRLQAAGGNLTIEPWGLSDLMAHLGSWEYDASPLEFAGYRNPGSSGTAWWVDVEGSAGNVRAQLNEIRVAVDTWRMQMLQIGEWVKDLKKDRDKDEKKPETWAERLLWQGAFPNHVLSKYLTDAELDARRKMSRKDAVALASRLVGNPANAVLFVVGNVDAGQVEKDVRTILGDWKADPSAKNPPPADVPPPPEPGPRKILVLDKPGSTQAEVSLLCQLPTATLDNQARRQVLSMVYSDNLWRALRETAGSTYGAYAYQSEYRGGVAFLYANTTLQNRTTDLALRTMLGGLQQIRDGQIDADKVQTFKWNLARNLTTGYQTTSQVLSNISSLESRGYPWDAGLGYPDQITRVGLKDLPPLLDRCIGHEIITVVGPKDTMVEEIEEAGYAAEVVDWEGLIQNPEKAKKK